MPVTQAFPDQQLQVAEFGSSWRAQFIDVDGITLNMNSFEQIDFGAISYKEIFQNVKTILATPIFSAALERTLGIDQTIVDLPIDQAQRAVIAIIDALYFWEPRVEVMDIRFEADPLQGHLAPVLQLKIRNVIYGTNQTYERTHITQPELEQELPMTEPVPGPPGPPGPVGPRGSLWFVGTDDPDVTPPSPTGPAGTGTFQNGDLYLNTTTGDIFQFVSSSDVTRAAAKGSWQRVPTRQKGESNGSDK
jgi:phage baseplate assembly protein W